MRRRADQLQPRLELVRETGTSYEVSGAGVAALECKENAGAFQWHSQTYGCGPLPRSGLATSFVFHCTKLF